MKKFFTKFLLLLLVVHAGLWANASIIPPNSTEVPTVLKPIPQRPPTRKKRPFPRIPFSNGTSTNWGGYVAVTSLTKPAANSVTNVSGSWTVPTIASSSNNTYSSIWLGIDGYASPTVQQIGTEHDWSNGHQQNYAWFEMYPNYAYEINGFPLNIGDVISASVVYAGNNVFTLTLVNNTRNVHTVIPHSYTTSAGTKRSCAEWVVEAPYENGVLPLANFGTETFTNCLATINGVTGSITNNHWKNDALTMVTTNGVPKAVPFALSSDGKSFKVNWRHQ